MGQSRMELMKELPCGHRIAFCPKGRSGQPGDLAHQKSESMVRHYNELFFEVYPHFAPARVLEVGVCRGGSLAIWRDMFGCEVIGVDRSLAEVTRSCRDHFDESAGFRLEELTLPDSRATNWGPYCLVIDDGGHGYDLTSRTFSTLWPSVRRGGLYIIEDWRLACFAPEETLGFLSRMLIGNETYEYAIGDVPYRLIVYRGLIAIEKNTQVHKQEIIDPTL